VAGVVGFWAVCLFVGAAALPIAFRFFRRFPDAGGGLAFPLGLVLLGYGYFILRTAQVLPPGRGGYLLAFALFALVGLAVAARDRRFWRTLRRSWPALLIAAGVFTLAFFAYLALRSYNAEIDGTEQPMDFMYLNASLESNEYPPRDPWMAGRPASYYYFGYLQVGVLTGVSGVRSSTGYNLGLAYTLAAAVASVVSLAGALARWGMASRRRRLVFAAPVLGAVLLVAVGSLSAVFELAAAHEQYPEAVYEAFGLESLLPCGPGEAANCYGGPEPRTRAWYPTEFFQTWWRGSRVIPATITEFPFFSFLLGDLHPHVMSIPLVLLSLGLAAGAFRGRSPLTLRTHARAPAAGVVLAVVLGGLAFENAWDVLTFNAVFAVAVAARNLRLRPPGAALGAAAGYLGPIFVAEAVAYVPWYLDFSSQASGFDPYVGPGTIPAHAFLQFGPLLFAALLTLVPALRASPKREWLRMANDSALVPLLPLVLWLVLAAWKGQLSDAVGARGAGGWTTLGLYGGAAWTLAAALGGLAARRRGAAFAAGLGATGALLLYGAELFYIRDIFVGSAPRLNTVFKLTYQAWVLLSVAGGLGIAMCLRDAAVRRRTGLLAAPALVLVLAGLVYPVITIPNRTEGLGKETATDGLGFLARRNPAEYALTRWIEDHTEPGDVIIEGTGRRWRRGQDGRPVMSDNVVDYTDAGRVAARTGRETPIGWFFHEIQWRGDTAANRQEFTRRQDLVDAAYTTDASRTLETMREFGATYLVVGSLEFDRYGDLMPPFETFLEIAFESGPSRVYRRPTDAGAVRR
jgi:YYY domain-containing protein